MDPQDFAPEPAQGVPAAEFQPAVAPAPTPAPAPAPEPDDEPIVESGPLEDVHGVIASDAHTIEHRSFARADADAPMPVTVITTRDSLTGA